MPSKREYRKEVHLEQEGVAVTRREIQVEGEWVSEYIACLHIDQDGHQAKLFVPLDLDQIDNLIDDLTAVKARVIRANQEKGIVHR